MLGFIYADKGTWTGARADTDKENGYFIPFRTTVVDSELCTFR